MKQIITTEQIIDIADVKQGTIILKNHALRAILMVSSLNFDLKSSEEQKAIIYAYQQFLNSLDFPLQEVIQSRQINIESYLQQIQRQSQTQNNELLEMQVNEYQNFIKKLIEMANIMSKKFYLVVPFSEIEAKSESVLEKTKKLIKYLNPATKTELTEKDFQRYREQLWQRVDYIVSGLSGIGLNVIMLDTEDILELFYNLYNK